MANSKCVIDPQAESEGGSDGRMATAEAGDGRAQGPCRGHQEQDVRVSSMRFRGGRVARPTCNVRKGRESERDCKVYQFQQHEFIHCLSRNIEATIDIKMMIKAMFEPWAPKYILPCKCMQTVPMQSTLQCLALIPSA